jgi:hypothetical protein
MSASGGRQRPKPFHNGGACPHLHGFVIHDQEVPTVRHAAWLGQAWQGAAGRGPAWRG